MNNLGPFESILHYLYIKTFAAGEATLNALDLWADHQKLDKTLFWQQYNVLIKTGLVLFLQDEETVRLTPKGALQVERAGLAPSSLIAQNHAVRKKFIHVLAEHATNRCQIMTVDELLEYTGEEHHYCLGNLHLLSDMGYIHWIIPKVNFTINMNVCAKESALSKSH